MRNKELFYKIADLIEREGDAAYNQAVWGRHYYEDAEDDELSIESAKVRITERACGSAHCIAGHAAVLSGWKPVVNVGYSWQTQGKTIHIDWEEMMPPEDDIFAGISHPSEIGMNELGLRPTEAAVLFCEYWRPVGWSYEQEQDADEMLTPDKGRAVASALRLLGDGASVWDVTHNDSEEE